MSIETQEALVAWYIEQMSVVREQVDAAQQQAFAAPAGDYTDEAVAAYVATIVPVMAAAQAAVAQLTAAYLAYMVADMTGKAFGSVIPAAVDLARVTGAAARNGAPPERVYRRPFEQVWTEIHELDEVAATTDEPAVAPELSRSEALTRDADPRSEPQPARRDESSTPEQRRERAMKSGERRARSTGLTDLQLTATRTAQDVLSANQSVVGYRRVLTGAENCGMCVVAATRLYHKRNLLPIHTACDCVVAPVMAGEDPGRTLNNKLLQADAVPSAFNKHGVAVFDADQTIDLGDLLQETHDAIAKRFGASFRDAKGIDYRKVITVRQHGELGPVLTVSRHKFTKRQLRDNNLRA
ncbi:MAG TPA: hypothetical protein VIQ30_24205 [Pseudonocardia sp.]